jgi:molybdopterin/thiamine biosynthesis adenylyltransferase/rhodanese-related sulfurtransferase
VISQLTRDELVRYSRHVLLPEVGIEGQQRLKAARVLCIGAGGLGSPAVMYLAAAGVGTIGLVDDDVVEVSNLQRQVIHGTPDVGRSKLASVADRLRAINPHAHLEQHLMRLDEGNALDLVSSFDVIVDGTDNFPTRYLVNDACVLAGRPNAYGSISRFEGQASVFAMPDGPCYRCLHPEPPPLGLIPSCAEGGVLGVLPGLVGTIQATEAIKLVLGIGQSLSGRFLIYDALRMRFREIALRRDPDCPVCGVNPTIRELHRYEDRECVVEGMVRLKPNATRVRLKPDTTKVRLKPDTTEEVGGLYMTSHRDDEMTVIELKALMDRGEAPTIVDVREPNEFEICRIQGAVLIPLRQLPSRVHELDPSAEVVLQCRSGVRSAHATAWLRQAGFARARNLTGGILAWIEKVDPTLPTY